MGQDKAELILNGSKYSVEPINIIKSNRESVYLTLFYRPHY
jgi:hypothetical protein